MRRNQGFIQVSKNQKLEKIGKFCFVILVVLLTFLFYNKAGAQELDAPESILFKNSSTKQDDQQERTDSENKNLKITVKDKGVSQEDSQKLVRSTFRRSSYYRNDLSKLKKDRSLYDAIAKELKSTKMEPMIDAIAEFDRETAALIVGIAKIESGYNRCNGYNCWGYAGGGLTMNDPIKAVKIVGSKIEEYKNKGLDTPDKIVYIWKCGDKSCKTHPPESVKRWIYTVKSSWSRIIKG
ncbi:MAG: hypothetical protein GF335_04770 [Candidatus Moranbacteria bacterium]|nr:hypothetical protein [Candidatus Moranbacteria bacterium]